MDHYLTPSPLYFHFLQLVGYDFVAPLPKASRNVVNRLNKLIIVLTLLSNKIYEDFCLFYN